MRNSYIDGFQKEGNHPFKREANKLAEQFHTDTTITNGVVRWTRSNNIPPKDILEFWQHLGYQFDMIATLEAADRDLDEIIARQRNRPISNEERYEMEAAFGKGTTVVDISTGRKIKL